ncbi:uncharacterized protein LOC133712580 isoform X2 [Rosa rugosa]|nr:uncharacterized protein LOC133712580 isoform X2 [Rosa rugosa]XP_061994669.1 uncharacterized protein LOC133712580 isoform X2 [Rosa rugosa]XP_061994670.1 uncharacterized protein LOC133712580 isoform X2 [Rosa rugosa]
MWSGSVQGRHMARLGAFLFSFIKRSLSTTSAVAERRTILIFEILGMMIHEDSYLIFWDFDITSQRVAASNPLLKDAFVKAFAICRLAVAEASIKLIVLDVLVVLGLAFHPLDGILQAVPHVIALFLVPMHFTTHTTLLFIEAI